MKSGYTQPDAPGDTQKKIIKIVLLLKVMKPKDKKYAVNPSKNVADDDSDDSINVILP